MRAATVGRPCGREHVRVVDVVLVNWNRTQDTLECLASLKESTYPIRHIIVMDNGSEEQAVEGLRALGDVIVLVENGMNLGFTGANNIGLSYALRDEAEYVLLLNNDALIAPDAVEQMITVAEEEPDVGIVAPKILFHPNRNLIWAAGTDYRPFSMTTLNTGYGRRDRGVYETRRDLAWATGCAMLLRTELVRQVGLLCDDYFAVGEDLDYSMRCRQLSWKIRYVPTAVVWHKESISAGGHDAPQYVYYQTRNSFIIHRRWARNRIHLYCARCAVLCYLLKRTLGFLVSGKRKSILGIAYGVRDGLAGCVGKQEFKELLH